MRVGVVIRLLRPGHWVKNLFCFAGVIFGGRLHDGPAVEGALRMFAAFCLLSSSVYVINDIADRNRDRQHPHKKFRPVASGEVSVAFATILTVILGAASAGMVFMPRPLPLNAAATLATYLALQLLYSFGLKHVVILDAMLLAMGFTLRAMGGAFAADVPLSPWLVVCSLLVALFLAFAKRRVELVSLEQSLAESPSLSDGSQGPLQRPVLEQYSLAFLDQLIAVSAATTILAYVLYTVDERTVRNVHPHMLYTTPLVLFGILRYLYLVYRKNHGESPALVLVRDAPLVAAFALWCALIVALKYVFPAL